MDTIEMQKNRDRNRRGDRPSRFSDSNIRERERSRDMGGRESCRVLVSNIPYEYKWTDVKDLFKKKVGGTTFVDLLFDDNNKSKGCGVVEFSSPEYVKKALEVMHRFPIEGRKLVVKEDNGNDRGRSMRDDRNDDFGSGQYECENYNTYGLNPQFLDSIGIRGPLLNRIFVANLFYTVDVPKLKEVFKMAGKVRNIDLSTDKDGKSRGFAVIEYDHPVEAVQAISMFDKQLLYDRKLAVRMDKVGNSLERKLPEGLVSVGPGLGPNGEPLKDVARNISQLSQSPSTQNNNGTAGTGGGNSNANSLQASGLLGAVPALGGLGVQALGQLGLGQLQSQLLQQGLGGGNDLSGLGVSDMGGSIGNNNLGSNLLSGLSSAAFGRQSGNNYPSHNMGHTNMSPAMHGDSMGGGNNGDRPSDMVVIRNLPPSMTWQLIREKFSEVGAVKFAEKIDHETAFVRFMSEWAAERAIKMFDQTRIDGRTISVRIF